MIGRVGVFGARQAFDGKFLSKVAIRIFGIVETTMRIGLANRALAKASC
jgi:hypothetical protein